MKRKKNTKAWDALKKEHSDYLIETGWFETSKYENGKPVGGIAAVQNFGAVINHPGGTPYFIGKDGLAVFISSDSFYGQLQKNRGMVTKPHTIVIPPTHFMETCQNKNKKKWAEECKKAWAAVFLGKIEEKTAMEALAGIIERDLIHSITDGNFPPDKPSTVRRKLATYSNKKEKGLLANRLRGTTGLMVDTISHKVTKK